ncbi:MAG: hypothetical protein ACYDG4_10870 [Desulfuromonadaceae bacterium]
MKVDIIYREPEDKPIERAEILTSFKDVFFLEVDRSSEVRIDLVGTRVDLTKADFADFAALCVRINKQING